MTRTTRRADDLNGRIKEADRSLGDHDDNPEGENDQATSTVHVVVEQDRWHYYHVSTP
jgi:uncharacterized protein YjbJ (UPF0337 family)